MATMKDIEKNLKKKGVNFEVRPDSSIRVVWTFENGRSQLVDLVSKDGLLIACSPIGKYEDNIAAKVLKSASQTFFGVAILFDEYIALVTTMPIADLDEDELEWCLGALPAAADLVEKEVFGSDDF